MVTFSSKVLSTQLLGTNSGKVINISQHTKEIPAQWVLPSYFSILNLGVTGKGVAKISLEINSQLFTRSRQKRSVENEDVYNWNPLDDHCLPLPGAKPHPSH